MFKHIGNDNLLKMKIDHIDMMLEIGQIGGEDIFIHNDKHPHGPKFTAKVS